MESIETGRRGLFSRPSPTGEIPRRGIAPGALLQQVRNTAPFLFEPGWEPPRTAPYLAILRNAAATLDAQPFREQLFDHYAYFELCLAAHHGTVATFVPTDVDNQIRFKLWSPQLPLETIVAMAELVEASRGWDYRPVSTRWVASPASGERVSGHEGEWFSTAVAAYGALRRRAPERAAHLASLMVDELARQARIFSDLKRAKDGIGLLKAATLIAHNLGDLDRVVDMWNLPQDDPFVAVAYKAGHAESKAAPPELAAAGALNKAYMAEENHRHFALRVPRCLRRSADLLLPVAPFLDDWGSLVARYPAYAPEEIGGVAEALVDGWERLAGPIGYARALAGMEQTFPGGLSELAHNMPRRNAAKLKAGALRSLVSIPRARFEGHWNHVALKL